ncbi:MAG: hypothetical protein KBD52_02485 [Candidatus Pacebacteria bacterium]|nr:hypothetical protein [Candidatus Paceibacterota bacterium]
MKEFIQIFTSKKEKSDPDLDRKFSEFNTLLKSVEDLTVPSNFEEENLTETFKSLDEIKSNFLNVYQEDFENFLGNIVMRLTLIKSVSSITSQISNIKEKTMTNGDSQSVKIFLYLNSFLFPILERFKENVSKYPNKYDYVKVQKEKSKTDPNSLNYLSGNELFTFFSSLKVYFSIDDYLPQIEKAFLSDPMNFDNFIEVFTYKFKNNFKLLDEVYEKGSNEVKDYLNIRLNMLILGIPSTGRQIVNLLSQGLGFNLNKKLSELLNNFFIKRYGLTSKNFTENLNYSADNIISSSTNLSKMIEKMDKIEKEIPSGVQELNERFNIYEFGRYPEEVLINQLKNKNEQEPYGLLIFPRSDHNGAFSTIRSEIENIYKDTQSKHLLRVFETSSRIDLVKILLKCNHKYGNQNKISFLVLGGHGDLESLDLGSHTAGLSDTVEHKGINKEDMKGVGIKKIKEFFVEKPAIVLISCKTGGDKGLVEDISKIYNAEVTAPKESTSVSNINVNYDKDGNPHFNVQWSKSGINSKYVSGKKVDENQS